MDYKWHYDRLMETRKERILVSSEYYERHHIIPKSMGGNDKNDNLIYLTPREHFIAHWLLWRIHQNREMALAFYTFCYLFNGHNHKGRPKITSARGFQEAREVFSLSQKKRMTGVNNSNRSKIVIQYDLDGNFIKEWPSAQEASRQLKISHITSCCRGERKWAGDFKWKYKYGVIKKSKPYKKREHTNKKLQIIDDDRRKRISNAASDRKWYNDGVRDYFLKPFESVSGLTPGRLANRKKK